MHDWRKNLIENIEELATLKGKAVATICLEYGKDARIHSRLLAGREMNATKAATMTEKLWREIKKARRARK